MKRLWYGSDEGKLISFQSSATLIYLLALYVLEGVNFTEPVILTGLATKALVRFGGLEADSGSKRK